MPKPRPKRKAVQKAQTKLKSEGKTVVTPADADHLAKVVQSKRFTAAPGF